MKAKDITPQLIEQLSLDGIELLCKLLWQVSSSEVQSKYPRYATSRKALKEMADEGVAREEQVGFKMAFELLTKLGRVSPERLSEKGVWLEEVSLFACRLGGTASIGDVEYFFRQRLDFEQRMLADVKGYAEAPTPPDWASKRVKESVRRYSTFKKMNLPYLMEKEAEMSGGEGDFTHAQRIAIYLRQRVVSAEERVNRAESILTEFQKGNRTPAILALGEELDAAMLYLDVENSDFDEKTGERTKKTKKGDLSVFVRKSKDNLTVEKDLLDSDYLLCKSLLQVLQPTVGTA